MTLTQRANLVDGAWRESADGAWMQVRNPADDREVVAEVPAMATDDVREVFDAAARARSAWGRTSAVARGRVLLETARLLRERRDDIATDLTREMGKTLAEASVEVGKSADFFEYCGGLGRASWGEV